MLVEWGVPPDAADTISSPLPAGIRMPRTLLWCTREEIEPVGGRQLRRIAKQEAEATVAEELERLQQDDAGEAAHSQQISQLAELRKGRDHARRAQREAMRRGKGKPSPHNMQ